MTPEPTVLAWTVSAVVRQTGSSEAVFTCLIAILLPIVSANLLAVFIRWMGADADMGRIARDAYLYTFGTFGVVSLVFAELADLFFVRHLIGVTVPACPTRSSECLLAVSRAASIDALVKLWVQGFIGLVGLIYLVVMVRRSTGLRLPLFALTALMASNVAIDWFVDQLIDFLKAHAMWT